MQEGKDKRLVGLNDRKGMPERKDERIAGLCLRKEKAKGWHRKMQIGIFQQIQPMGH